MAIFDKLINELINNKFILNGDLIQPNHFQFTVKLKYFFAAYEKIRRYGYKLKGISKSLDEHKLELDYYFTIFVDNRDFLLSVHLILEEGEFLIPSLGEWEYAATIFENKIMSHSQISFTQSNRQEPLLIFTSKL